MLLHHSSETIVWSNLLINCKNRVWERGPAPLNQFTRAVGKCSHFFTIWNLKMNYSIKYTCIHPCMWWHIQRWIMWALRDLKIFFQTGDLWVMEDSLNQLQQGGRLYPFLQLTLHNKGDSWLIAVSLWQHLENQFRHTGFESVLVASV